MGIEIKSIGSLIDELITTSMKCWHAQETICTEKNTDLVAFAGKAAQKLNRRRNELIQAIDAVLGQSNLSPTVKTYGNPKPSN